MYNYAFEILIVDDSQEDVELITEVLRDKMPSLNLHVAENGSLALAFLERTGPFAQAPRPDIIFLDLNMPGYDGREILVRIKQNANFCSIPVIILTTSAAEQDIALSYQNHANCYIKKPADLAEFSDLMETLLEFWFSDVKLATDRHYSVS